MADFRWAILHGANLYEADLRGATLYGADLHEVDLRSAALHEVDLRTAVLRGADLYRAILHGANFRSANLCEADLCKADLRRADLRGADFHKANLDHADLSGLDLSMTGLNGACLSQADLNKANLRSANLPKVDLHWAILNEADLREADLSGADLRGAYLSEANLCGADLSGADLSGAYLSEANLAGATLERSILVNTHCNKTIFTECRIHGISAWNLRFEEAKQTNLIITPTGEPDITVDNLEVAQFIYLLLNNPRIREVIDTITSKVVLILGRFTPERKVVLDAIREKLRIRNYSPVVFDFEKPMTRDLTETVMTLAGMARFVIADITDAKSIPQELMAIVPNLPSVAVQPLLLASQQEYGMFEHFKRFPWVLDTVLYQDQETLLSSLESMVILPAEQKAKELFATQRK
jgi:uncharacterized protein YjbI with pentapeptide repeats